MIAVVNVGNTHTQVGYFIDGIFSEIIEYPTSSFCLDMLPLDVEVLVSSVVPEVVERLKKHPNISFLSSKTASIPLDLTKVDTSTTGADRLANAVALSMFYPLPGLVIDCGTAITVEIVDENRCFRGGAIAPGRKLMRQILSRNTAQLPDVKVSEKLKVDIGFDTISSIDFGVDIGALGMIKELVSRCVKQYCCKTIIGTGGDIDAFVEYLDGVKKVKKDFTLQGILSSFYN